MHRRSMKNHQLMILKKILLIVTLLSFGALGFSFIAQFVWHLSPCMLCQIERILTLITGISAFIGLFLPWKLKIVRWVQICLGIAFLVAAFHFAVQLKILADPCSYDFSKIQSVKDYDLLLQSHPRCSQISWQLWKLPMSFYNALYSFLLLIFIQWGVVFSKKKGSN